MNLLPKVRKDFIYFLLHKYIKSTPEISYLIDELKKNNRSVVYDHFAIIDLPGTNSGIGNLRRLFSSLGFQARGKGYLKDKQNDFLWLAEENAAGNNAENVLPQVVVADFRLEECSHKVKNIIEKYSLDSSPAPFATIEKLSEHSTKGDKKAAEELVSLLCHYFEDKQRTLPTVDDFKIVHSENQLLAWSLVFEKEVNHFAIAVHLLDNFNSLGEFNQYLENQLHTDLNNVNGQKVKGQKEQGISQSSSIGKYIEITLQDGQVQIPGKFIEFVWRYPVREEREFQSKLWEDFFVGFVAQNANTVIESLYEHS